MSVLGSHREEQVYAAAVVLAGGLMGYLFVGDFGLRQGLLGLPPAPAITIDVPKVRVPIEPASRPSGSDRLTEGVSVPTLDAQPSSAPEPLPVPRPAPSPPPRPSPSAVPVPVPPPGSSEEPRPTQEPPGDDPAEGSDDDGPNKPKNASGGKPKPPNNNKPGPKPGPKPG